MKTISSNPKREFGIRFVMLARRWRRELDAALVSVGLTDATWMPLVHLNETGGGITQKQLAARLGIDASSLVRLLDILERQNLIARRADETDGRARLVDLTEAGHIRVAEILAQLWQTEAKMLAGLDEAQTRAMLDGFEAINLQIETHQEVVS